MINQTREAKAFNRALERAISKGQLLEMAMYETVEEGRRVCRYAQESGLDESGYQRLVVYHVAGGRYKVAQVYADRAKERLGAVIDVPEAPTPANVVSFAEAKSKREKQAQHTQQGIVKLLRADARHLPDGAA